MNFGKGKLTCLGDIPKVLDHVYQFLKCEVRFTREQG